MFVLWYSKQGLLRALAVHMLWGLGFWFVFGRGSGLEFILRFKVWQVKLQRLMKPLGLFRFALGSRICLGICEGNRPLVFDLLLDEG